MLKIESVEKYSVAEELKIKAGDELVKINGQDINDILDYIFFDSLEDVDITIRKQNGKTVTHEISKEEPLGLVFGDAAEIESCGCSNNCVFCFVDQLPRGMRDTLYFKDDDYRLSFISGNYVTLTNIGETEINRIIRQKISPLYISVHAADTALRRKLLGNESAEDIIAILKRFSEAGIKTHCQIVLCGGLNDGDALAETATRLFELYPAVSSLAVVPVGLTKHRQGLYPLNPLTADQAAAATDFAESFNKRAKEKFIFCSDEMYQIAGKEPPSAEYYGDYAQIENGVGLLRKFETEFMDALSDAPPRPNKDSRAAVLVTGISAAPFLTDLIKEFNKKFPQITVSVLPVKNTFFGESVTVAGLVTGGDIIKTLTAAPQKADKIIIPKSMLKEFSTLFLDNVEFSEIEKATKIKTVVCAVDGAALVEKLLNI